MSFKEFLSEKREAVPTPDNIVDELGNCYFGTFDKEFPKMDFLKVNRPSSLPNFFNKTRLTLWEATEINFDKVNKVRGMDIVIVTTANTNEEAKALLEELGMPFAK